MVLTPELFWFTVPFMTRGNTQAPGTMRNTVLRGLRLRFGITSADLAKRAGISASYLSKIESGDKPGTPAIALRLARALEVPLETIYDLNPDSGVDLYVLSVPREAAPRAS